MQFLDGRLIVSPSDLTGFLECEHLTQQELAAARGEIKRPERNDPELEVLTRRGLEHEARHLASLRTGHRRVVEFPFPEGTIAGLTEAHAQTVAAMQEGAEVIYQGTFFDGRWRCHPDFLLRIDRPSKLGSYSYEVADAKLARKAKAAAVLQCCVYAEQVAAVQGVEPEQIRLILGDGSEEELRLKDYGAYYRSVKRQFEQVVFASPAGGGQGGGTYPDPVDHCRICRWIDVCEARRRQDDHLCLVAGMRRDQTRRLNLAGIKTVNELGASPVDQPIHGINEMALSRLRQQARLQVHQRQSDTLPFEVLPPLGEHIGFQALPAPTPDDLFFDMEGDPFVGDNGLEYLFGVLELNSSSSLPPQGGGLGRGVYHPLWAHDPDEERRAFEQVVDFLIERLNRNPDLHVYHYATYEPNALKYLASTCATREAEVDRLLRGRVLVDLYRIVRQSVRIGTESYSLKELESLYRGKRSTEIVDAAGSIVAYEDWLESRDQRLLDEIARYNADDCLSTAQLRDWLEARRLEAIAQYGEIPRPGPEEVEPSEILRDIDERTAALVDRLLEGVPEEEDDRSKEQQARYLLAHSLNWHRREGKSEWWEYYRKCSLTDEQLVEDREAIGAIEFRGEVRPENRSNVFRYWFDPNQEYKIGIGDQPHDPRTESGAGEVVAVDPIAGWIELSRGVKSESPHPTSLIPASPIPTKEQRDALMRLGQRVADHGFSGIGPYQAARGLLCLEPPRIDGVIEGAPLVQAGERAKDVAVLLAPRLNNTYLAIQGPPGSGKTTIGAELIVDLVQLGKRVGITANSHKVIGNLLDKTMGEARRRGQVVRAMQKADERDRCKSQDVQCTNSSSTVELALAADEVEVVAGTPWLFARASFPAKLDYLVVDEAGQMALANVLAIAGAANNLILLGDPNQLRQPSHGIHPEGVDRSVLDHVIQDQPTMPTAYGLFLETTYRLHPTVCAFVSEAFYDGKLEPDDSTKRQNLAVSNGSGGLGLRYLPAEHSGNRTLSPEEVDRVNQTFRALLGLPWTDREGAMRPIAVEDVLVVAPYNAQVRRLIETLPEGARIGTVDKFQGQEAPIVIYSMATSSVDDAPRGMDFLFSLNRLNVAASRAQGLVMLVCSPELLKARCRTPDQMRLASALCRLVEIASGLGVTAAHKRTSTVSSSGGLENH
ncbi:MAG: TM0106 family RecB-like putative nuclease [Candidatus Dormibacteraeota bacterium]|nr:TM0106 family RecB-like putative nuclease [Candidatus Dormibacteraeota bacterium]